MKIYLGPKYFFKTIIFFRLLTRYLPKHSRLQNKCYSKYDYRLSASLLSFNTQFLTAIEAQNPKVLLKNNYLPERK